MKRSGIYIALLLPFLLAYCDSGPKVIESEPAQTGGGGASVFQEVPGMQQAAVAEEHKVVAEEALPTEKYTYVRVNENGQSFWIAIPKRQ